MTEASLISHPNWRGKIEQRLSGACEPSYCVDHGALVGPDASAAFAEITAESAARIITDFMSASFCVDALGRLHDALKARIDSEAGPQSLAQGR
jgi:hypothetical protein